MSTKEHSDRKACWGLLWRSLVFMPYMLAVFVCVGSVWLSRWVLPFVAALLAYSRDWSLTLATVSAWLVAVWGYRRFRLARFFEPPPSLL